MEQGTKYVHLTERWRSEFSNNIYLFFPAAAGPRSLLCPGTLPQLLQPTSLSLPLLFIWAFEPHKCGFVICKPSWKCSFCWRSEVFACLDLVWESPSWQTELSHPSALLTLPGRAECGWRSPAQKRAAPIYLLLHKPHRERLRASLNAPPWKYRRNTVSGSPWEHSSHAAVWFSCLSTNSLCVSAASTTSISLQGVKPGSPLEHLQTWLQSTSLFFQRCMKNKWWIQHREYQLTKKSLPRKTPADKILFIRTHYKKYTLWKYFCACSRIRMHHHVEAIL